MNNFRTHFSLTTCLGLAGCLMFTVSCAGAQGEVASDDATSSIMDSIDDPTGTGGDAEQAQDGDVNGPNVGDAGRPEPPRPAGEIESSDGVMVVDLPGVVTDSITGLSETLTVEVPDGGYSLSISVSGAAERWYTIHNIVAPDGSVLAGQSWMTSPTNQGGHALCLDCANRISASTGAGAVLVPITPSIPVISGTYSFQLASFDVESASFFEAPTYTYFGGSLDVKVVIKYRPEGLPQTGRLDLNLFFTGAGDLQADAAPTDARIVAGLEAVVEAYAQVGISIGNVTYGDIDESHQYIDGIAGEGNDFEAAAAATEGAPAGVNVIFVEEIIDSSNPLGGFGVILGVSGGIPGPIGTQGTSRSAVIVDISPPAEGGALPIGTTIAHEMGHYLGLFHSSELSFLGLHDPIADTADNDTTNLMYFEASASGAVLSIDQGRVMRSNGWITHEEEN